jgi:hypothetical protein
MDPGQNEVAAQSNYFGMASVAAQQVHQRRCRKAELPRCRYSIGPISGKTKMKDRYLRIRYYPQSRLVLYSNAVGE